MSAGSESFKLPDDSVAARLLARKQMSRSKVAELEAPKITVKSNGAEVEVPESPDEPGGARLLVGKQTRRGRAGQTSTRDVAFLSKAEDGVYVAAGFVKEEAKNTEEIAERVENFSTVIEKDVDKLEAFVHQVNMTTESMEKDVSQASMDLQRFSSPNTELVAQANPKIKDFLDLGWGWNVFRVFLVALTIIVVILHNWGGLNNIVFENEQAAESTSASPHTSTTTVLGMLLINLGPVVKVLSFAKNVLTSEKKFLTKVEEDVDEAAREVKKTVETVEEVAQAVEKVSKQVEKGAEDVQTFVGTVKATTTTTKVAPNHDRQHQ